MCSRLEGATALVTGGASGIGAATARRLAREGARVVVADLDLEGAKVVAKEVDGLAVELDVTDPVAVRTTVAAAEEAMGSVDVLVNNAGGARCDRVHEGGPGSGGLWRALQLGGPRGRSTPRSFRPRPWPSSLRVTPRSSPATRWP